MRLDTNRAQIIQNKTRGIYLIYRYGIKKILFDYTYKLNGSKNSINVRARVFM